MPRKVIHLSGQQAEYDLRMMQTDAGPMPVLIGISGRAMGEVHYLTATEEVEFADTRIELAETVLADTKQASNQSHTVDKSRNEQNTDSFTAQTTSAPESEELNSSAAHKLTPSHPAPSNYSHAAENKIEEELKTNRDHNTDLNQNQGDKAVQTSPPPAQDNIALPLQAPIRHNLDSGDGTSAVQYNVSHTSSSVNIQPEIKLIEGTPAADRLVGTFNDDRIDGLRNLEISGSFFHEEFLAGNGNDMLFYRGFFGDINVNQHLEASLRGEAGNDVLDVVLDRATQIDIDGGDGQNSLTLQALDAPYSPWQHSFMEWSWTGTPTAPTLQGVYTSALHPQAGIAETTASFQTISAGNSTPLNIIRPDALSPLHLTGGAQADFLLANAQTLDIHGGAGNDTIIARDGNIVDAGTGINSIFAYSSNVTLSYTDSPYAVNLNLANKIGLIFDDASNIYLADRLMSPIQNATGSTHNDVLKGDQQDNSLRTHGGSDALEGGAGADTFIIDVDGNSTVAIYDFNIDETDQVLINLSQWTSSSGDTSFNQYQVVGDDNQVWWSGALSQQEGALLTVLISQDNHDIQIGHDGQMQTAVAFDEPIDHITIGDWTTALHIDYM